MDNKPYKTRCISVGNILIGGNNPIRIQSMTTSPTSDVEATIEQAIKLADQGCEIVRVTVQGIKEALACQHIKNSLLQKGYTIPIVADIHFFPSAAMEAIEFVDKVRINPGNFADKRATFKILNYDQDTYEQEIERIKEKFTPLVLKCKKLKKPMRIGTNHGSLSDRIMNRYGDTPQGMVESALEYAKICRQYDYHDIIFSMKASNPKVMIEAYRLLVAKMMELGWDYPLHLGVTEAGNGEDGRIKSAIGIGSLLLDGLGDTIRVSLTEDPWHEIDPCKRLINLAKNYQLSQIPPFISSKKVILPQHISMHPDGTVLLRGDTQAIQHKSDIVIANEELDQNTAKQLKASAISIIKPLPISAAQNKEETDAVIIDKEDLESWDTLKQINPSIILLSPVDNRLYFCRRFFKWSEENNITAPVILNFNYNCSKKNLAILAAAECGALLSDKLGDGLYLNGPYDTKFLHTLSLNILQASRMRMTKTDFISCPSCGRTLFDLQEVTEKIKKKTGHLPGVKIAIMGCIVNGPGEMADADFGYVGSKPGKIDLYVGKECVEKNIDFLDADEQLIKLIKAHNRWVDPQPTSTQTHLTKLITIQKTSKQSSL